MLLEARRAFSREFMPRPTAMFGSPAKWEGFARRHPEFREAMPRLHHLMEGAFIRTFHVGIGEPSVAEESIFYLGRLCVEDFSEILLVCGNGYGIAGKKLLRGLYERVLTGWYLHLHPAEARDFKDHWNIQRYKNAVALRAVYGDDFLNEQQMAFLKERADEVKERFVVAPERTKLRHAWTKMPVQAMAHTFPDVGKYHELAYTDTLAHVHANYGGIEQRLKVTETANSFGDETPASVDDAVLTAAHALVLQAIRVQVEQFKLATLEQELEACVQDFVTVWEKGRPARH